MSLVSKTAACIVMAAMLAAPKQAALSPLSLTDPELQFQVEVLKRQVILQLVDLGKLQSRLEASNAGEDPRAGQARTASNVREDQSGFQRAPYPHVASGALGVITETTPEECALLSGAEKTECEKHCPICSKLTIGHGGGFPNNEAELIIFTRAYIQGSAVAAETLADISELVDNANQR